jgi:hypothetical protein
MLDLEQFNKIPSGTDFASGIAFDSPEELNMTGSGKSLKWIAVKGWANDWSIYTHWDEYDWDYVKRSGDKVMSREHIKFLVPCDRDVFNKYRY